MKVKKFTVLLLAACLFASGCVPTDVTQQPPTPAPIETPATVNTPAPVDMEAPGETVQYSVMETDTLFEADVDGDGALETLLFTAEEDEDSIFGTSLYLTVTKGGAEQKIKVSPAAFHCAYYMEAGNKRGIAVTGSYENDYMQTSILAFEGTNVKELSVTDGGIMSVEGSTVVLNDVLFALGTWAVEIEYVMTPNLELIPAEGKEWTIYGCDNPLTVKKELPVEFETDACTYGPETLPIGTQIWLVFGDGESFVRFTTEDGRIGRLFYTMVDGNALLVDGTPETDWLDGIVYAG